MSFSLSQTEFSTNIVDEFESIIGALIGHSQKSTGQKYIFGVELEPDAGAAGVHPFIHHLMEHIVKKGKKETGVFRKNGRLDLVRNFIDKIEENKGKGFEKDLKKLKVHEAASLLKTYFRLLKNPLCSTNEFEEQIKEELLVKKRLTPEGLKKLKEHISDKMPKTHAFLLHRLVKYINDFSQFEKKTLMGKENLARVWAPNVIIPTLPDFSKKDPEDDFKSFEIGMDPKSQIDYAISLLLTMMMMRTRIFPREFLQK